MIFEKKIIIGSIISFIATMVGIIAVFFPDAFNLQKEKVVSFSASINNKQEVQKFVGFLDKMAKEKKIFQLDVMICFPSSFDNDKEYLSLDNFLISSDGTLGDTETTMLTVVDPTIKGLSPEEINSCFLDDGSYSSVHCGGKDYIFNNKTDKGIFEEMATEWIWDWSRMAYAGKHGCDNREKFHKGLAITGYFVNSVRSEYKGSIENRFDTIPKKQIILKQY